MKKKFAAIAAIALTLVASSGAYFAYHYQKEAELASKLQPLVKGASTRVSHAFHGMTAESSITWGELFKRFESAIEKSDEGILDAKSIDTSADPAKAKAAEEYLRVAQDATRSVLAFDRKMMAMDTANERIKGAREEAMSATGYSAEYAHKSLKRTLEQALEAAQDAEKAGKAAIEALNAFGLEAEKAKQTIDPSWLVPKEEIDRVRLHIEKRLK